MPIGGERRSSILAKPRMAPPGLRPRRRIVFGRASRKIQGIFAGLALRTGRRFNFPIYKSVGYGQIPCATAQGTFSN
jgi:hypothetical protein